MSNYPNTTLTNAGQDLIAESIAEGKALIFTKVELGDGNLAAGQSISTLTALISSKMNVPLSSGSANNGQAKLRFAVGNSGLEEGFFAREVGVFAKAGADGVETLYAYTNGGNYVDFIPDQSRPIDDQIMDVYIVTGNAAEVQIQVDSAAYLTARDLIEHNDNFESHKTVYGAFLRQKETAYALKDVVYLPLLGAKFYLECTTPGTTSNTNLTVASPAAGNTVTDGTVTWTIRKIGSGSGLPLGAIIPFAGTTPPEGYLLCNGAAVSRTMYPDLYTLIGTTYGSGNGSTTFNLPDYRFTDESQIPVYGNGKALAFSDGTILFGARTSSTSAVAYTTSAYGQDIGAALTSGTGLTSGKVAGAATKALLGNNLENSGLVAELPDSANTKYIIKAFDGQTSSSALIDVTQYAQDLANKATRDLDNLTEAGLKVITDLIPEGTGIVAQNLATNGYIKFANGFILQWGTYSVSATTTDLSVTFPIAFPTACNSVVISCNANAGADFVMRYFGVTNISKTGFTKRYATSASTPDHYIAVGY